MNSASLLLSHLRSTPRRQGSDNHFEMLVRSQILLQSFVSTQVSNRLEKMVNFSFFQYDGHTLVIEGKAPCRPDGKLCTKYRTRCDVTSIPPAFSLSFV